MGEKRRANAKAPTEKVTIHAHEKLTFAELLDTAIAAIARPLAFKIVAEKLRTRHFTITWSLFRTAAYKNMQLNSEDHYKSMLTAASSKPAPVITLDMKELEVRNHCSDLSFFIYQASVSRLSQPLLPTRTISVRNQASGARCEKSSASLFDTDFCLA